MRKLFLILSLWFGLTAGVFAVETLTLTLADGTSVTGDILKADDNGAMFHTTAENYTTVTIQWAQLSQDSLKQLAGNPKYQAYAEPFIEPTQSSRPQKPEVQINPVTRLERPDHPSVLLGLLKSPVGLFILFVLYAANLFAAYEISIIKARTAAQVMGLAAVLPVIGPVIFLAMAMQVEKPPEEPAATPAPAATETKPLEEIQIGEASWKPQEEKKPESQIYTRGKFTFNKRFVETRFAAFVGATEGDLAKKYSMEVQTIKERFAVERIKQVEVAEVTFETPKGPVTVPLSDIQEIKLNPRPPA